MMDVEVRPVLYLETTVISYLAAAPSRDLVVAAHQQATREWWATSRNRFRLVTSELVIREAEAGDPDASSRCLSLLADVELLDLTDEIVRLAEEIVGLRIVPHSSVEDALHIAVAVVNGCHYLLTWNYRHMANAVIRTRIERFCREKGYEPPAICTPEELQED